MRKVQKERLVNGPRQTWAPPARACPIPDHLGEHLRRPYLVSMEYPEVIFARLDAPSSEALSRVSGIAAGLGWEIEDGYTERDFFCRLPSDIAGAPDIFLQVRTSPGEQILVCELRHNFMGDVPRYRAVLSAAVKIVRDRYREAHGHNLDPFIEMFPQNWATA